MAEDYPNDFQEFLKKFQTDKDCWDYLFKIRWSEGFDCPQCNGAKYYMNNRSLAECKECGHQTSVTAGTIFQGTRKPLLLWFHVIWWVAVQKTGVSASNFKDFMGFGSYETAWAWLHKLRRAMIRTNREKLTGEVEVDETYIGGKESGIKNNGKEKRGRGNSSKILVVVATECYGKQIGRVRFRIIKSATSKNLLKFIDENIEQGSTVITDGWKGYLPLSELEDYKHVKKTILGSGIEAHKLLPHVHMVDSLLKRWINGTHQGNISSKHLEFYLDEFAFRFNRKLSAHRGKIFFRLIYQAANSMPRPLKDLASKKKHE